MLKFWQQHRRWITFVLALVAPLVVVVVLVPFRSTFTNAAAAVILIAVVLAVAIAGSRLSGYVASLSTALWFDFFLTRPYERFAISHRADIETTISLVVVGLLVSELAARIRHYSRVSKEESHYIEMVRDLSALANSSTASAQIIDRAQPMLIQLLDLRSCRFDPMPSDPPMARILSDGSVVHVGMHWPVTQMGIPGPETEIVTEWRGRALGRFVLTPTPGEPVTRERRVVAALLASLVAAALSYETRVQ